MRLIYAERRSVLQAVWQRELGDSAPLLGDEAGMHMVASLPDGLGQRVSDVALRDGIVAQSLHSFAIGKYRGGGIVLGYGAVNPRTIKRLGAALARKVAVALG
jgi:GntR family transcriptional regulator/MocR family aminotransferase